MKKYKLYWLDGHTEIIEGYDAVDAFNRVSKKKFDEFYHTIPKE